LALGVRESRRADEEEASFHEPLKEFRGLAGLNGSKIAAA
jgi:hypothetical protein